MRLNLYAAIAMAGRILLALIFIFGSVSKTMQYSQMTHLMEAHGVSGILLPAVIALEFLGGLALAVGILTRLAAAALAIFSVAAIVIFLLPPANPQIVILILAELGMIGGLLSYVATGAGRFSVDRILFGKMPGNT